MSRLPIIDAGPPLNFFAANKERILIGVLGELSAPETVKQEVKRKCRVDRRFDRRCDEPRPLRVLIA